MWNKRIMMLTALDGWKVRAYRVIRFWNSQVLEETEAVRDAIWMAVEGLSPPS